ncbi:MAG TPA: ATP-binding cassette domain-containing protein [Beijerinckiaceae bacterium]|nr:ATP-binding cassette domain-containing protein [Beijerinckiaceae bacterium]
MAGDGGPFVALDNVTHIYPGAEDGAPAVEDLSLTVGEGEFVAIVGPSGCGKSTVMKLATGLQFPRRGSVIVAGATVDAPVKLAGMAFQNPVMLLAHDAREPLAAARDRAAAPLRDPTPAGRIHCEGRGAPGAGRAEGSGR